MSEKIVKKDEKYDNSKFWIEYGIDLDKRKVMLDEDIDEYSIGWVFRGILKMVETDFTAPIDVYISSWGGSIYDGFVLIDLLESLDYLTVRTHATGKIMSMAFIIYLIGDERYCSKRARFMHHKGSTWISGDIDEIKAEGEEMKEIENMCDEIVSERTTKSKKQWKKIIQAKNFYCGKQKAKDLGIVTHDYPIKGR